ncbi:MAG: hypothetical protein K1X44_00800 [Alphaproteobacteria bacterium]|nr:hypothetical protein [Alphaproteobacteria bacterium]
MASWSDLKQELILWDSHNLSIYMWWRDDDAVQFTPELQLLLNLAKTNHCPITLAVIPYANQLKLDDMIHNEYELSIVQHGYRHHNHETYPTKKSEFGLNRSLSDSIDDLHEGQLLMKKVFGPYALPVLVPPWNRIDDRIIDYLPSLGFKGLSTFGTDKIGLKKGILQWNCHIDPINWHQGKSFYGESQVIDMILHEIQKRRFNSSSHNPLGLLTHHLIHDKNCWNFIQNLLDFSQNYSCIQWISLKSFIK